MNDSQTGTLTASYVRAVARKIPERQRDEVRAELRERIADETDARIAAGEEPAAAEYAVLKDLGDPGALAALYADRTMYLIGPRYYLAWWRLLVLVLWCGVLPTVVVITVIKAVQQAPVGEIIGGAIWIAIEVSVHICFWVTVIIVIVERTTRPTAKSPFDVWTPEMLNTVPDREVPATKGEFIANIVTVAIIAGALLWDHFIGGIALPYPGVPIINPALWPWWYAAALVMLILQVLLAAGVYRKGRWDYRFAATNACYALIVAGGVLWLISQGALINPGLATAIAERSGNPATGDLVTLILNIVAGFLFVGLGAASSWEGFRRARHQSRLSC
ncbi:MAG: permease prefix domain 1-containing protein [Microbacterium sp.]